MIDFDELEAHNSDAIALLAHTDSTGCQRGACERCDCLEWVGWRCASDFRFKEPRPYNMLRHELAHDTGAADPCSRCGCRASWHEDVSELVAYLSAEGALVEADDNWTDVERALFCQTGGAFHPTRQRRANRVVAEVSDGILVSVICPTEYDRRDFLPSLYECFCQQTHVPKELVVVDTGLGRTPSDFFTSGPPAADPRVVYRFFDATALQWSIGVKRNAACYLAQGTVIVHFDDDDLYAPTYVAWMVRSLQEGTSCSSRAVHVRVMQEDANSTGAAEVVDSGPDKGQPAVERSKLSDEGDGPPPMRQSSFAAEAATLSAWYTYNAMTGVFGYCDVDGSCGGRLDWTLGYGFSFAYRRSAWRLHWFRDMSLGEDHKFFAALLARGARVALLRDQGANLCAHTRHPSNFSPWERDIQVDQRTVSSKLAAMGERLHAAVGNTTRALGSLGNDSEVRLTRKTAEAMQNDLLAAFLSEGFQERLWKVFLASTDDPVRQKSECRQVCLEVQGPIIAKFGFPPTFTGVLASTAAFRLVVGEEEWVNTDSLQFRKGQVINWLMQPVLQLQFPKEREEIVGQVAELLKRRRCRS